MLYFGISPYRRTDREGIVLFVNILCINSYTPSQTAETKRTGFACSSIRSTGNGASMTAVMTQLTTPKKLKVALLVLLMFAAMC
jgi:hypothetical protein